MVVFKDIDRVIKSTYVILEIILKIYTTLGYIVSLILFKVKMFHQEASVETIELEIIVNSTQNDVEDNFEEEHKDICSLLTWKLGPEDSN